MIQRIYFILFAVCLFQINTFSQGNTGELTGVVKDASGNPVPFANVVILSSERIVTGTTTDFEGYYALKPINAGTYTVKVSAVGYAPQEFTGLVISASQTKMLDVVLGAGIELMSIVVTEPLIRIDQTMRSQEWDLETISHNPGGNLLSMLSVTPGVISNDRGTSAIGSRGDLVYFVDGVRQLGRPQLPLRSVGSMQVILGGLPADIGDATGGVVIINTLSGL